MAQIISEKLTIKQRPKDAFISAAEFFIKFFSIEIACLLLILIIAAIWFLAVEYSSNIVEFRGLAAEKQSQLEMKNQEWEALKGIKAEYQNLAAAEKKILDVLPAEKNEAEIFVQLESLANKNNISIESVDIASNAGKEDKERLRKISVTASAATGDYVALKKFLGALEKNLRLFDVKAINFEPNGKTVNLILNAYYYVE
jgi:Tfp pilus assembly protein PilO